MRFARNTDAKRRRAPYEIAMVYAHLGNAIQAFAWLEKAYQQHDWQIQKLKIFLSGTPHGPIRGSMRYCVK
jgi:hypothetical protein